MKCIVVTPNKLIFENEANVLVIPSIDGELGIHENHAPLVTLLSKGRLVIHSNGEILKYSIEGGFAEVRSNVITILADKVEGTLKEPVIA